MKKENYFRNFKRIGIAVSLAVTVVAALFVGCADGNSGPSTTNAAEIRVEIDAQNLRLIDNGQNTVAITIRTVPALSTIAELRNADTITVPIAIDGTAASRVEKSEGGSFESVPDGSIPITISSAATSKTITLRVRPDSGTEDDDFTVRIGTLTLVGQLAVTDDYTIKVVGAAGTTLPENKELTVTVIDNEKPSVSARVNPAPLVEGTAGNLELTLNNPPSGGVAVTASVGDEVPLTLAGGKSAMRIMNTTTLSIPIESIDNNQNEADASYTITIETTTAEVVVVHPMLTLTVRDDDIPQLSISPNIATIDEGGRTATFTITASIEPYRDIMVGYAIDGTGGADSADYTDANNGMVTIRKGTRTASISISAVDDALPNEISEGLTLTLGTITPEGGAAIDTTANSAAITIQDNDGTDTDDDGVIDSNDRCSGAGFATGWRSTAETDADRDGCRDSDEDIDDDGDGLIEIETLTQLNNMRYNLAGTSYREAAHTIPITVGAPTAPTENCTTTPTGGIYLCGYELMRNLNFDVDNDGSTWDAGTFTLDSADHNAEYFPITTPTATGGWLPIGDSVNKFNAIFEGNNHTITNLAIRRNQARIGLFGNIGPAAHIRSIGLPNYLADYTGTDNNVRIGSLAGSSNGTIAASYASGRANGSAGENRVGGLVGYQDGGTIRASHASGNVDGGDGGENYVGGLVGYSNGTIHTSYAIGNVDGNDGGENYVGGLAGYSNGTISASYAIGSTDGGGNNNNVGGLVGWQEGGTIRASHASGSANSGDGDDDYVGGLVGYQNGGTISMSYAGGNVDGDNGEDDKIGGLAGYSNGTIHASYATGRIDGGADKDNFVGGLVGQQDGGTIRASYATGRIDGGSGKNGIVGGLVGWQINGGIIIASYASGNVDGGSGDSDFVGGLVGIQSSGTIIASYATGSADGGDGNDEAGGLVGRQLNGGTISASYATGSADGGNGSDEVGGLVGNQNVGTIIASYTSGHAYGGAGNDDDTNNVGGLVGKQDNGTIRASYATGTANGDSGIASDDNVGGLVGNQNDGTIIASYATGGANGGDGDDNVGGLVGAQQGGTIRASYATGTANGVELNNKVGSLVGLRSGGTSIASYGFGGVVSGDPDGISPLLPSGVTAVTDLTEENAGSCTVMTALTEADCTAAPGTNTWTSWNAQSGGMNAWDFGDNTQAPALRFADYDGTGSANDIDYCGTEIPATFADGTRIICSNNGSLIPGQGR